MAKRHKTIEIGNTKSLCEFRVSAAAVAKALDQFSEAVKKAGFAIADLKILADQEAVHIHRNKWWKRGELPPNYVVDKNSSEWWERGDDPDFSIGV